jgi:O-antigen ligase
MQPPFVTRHTLAALARFTCALGALMLLLGLAGYDSLVFWRHQRGIETGLAPDQPLTVAGRFGTNVALERYEDSASLRCALDQARELGLGVVRQRIAWGQIEPEPGRYDWTFCDRILPEVEAAGLSLIAVIETSPAWARAAWEQDNPWAPPADPAQYARFAGAFAARYGVSVLAYQIWDSPNIAPHWGNGAVDPAGYVALLHATSEAIRQADPAAIIIAGGLAPNLEPGGRNMSDVLYLREINRRGAGAYYDVLGVKAYGFWSGPDDRRTAVEVLNLSRTILLRDEMRRRGLADRPIWVLEGGWCALPADWAGETWPLGSDTPLVQSQRLAQTLERIEQEWPWASLLCLQELQPDAGLESPAWGQALLGPDDAPTALGLALRRHLSAPRILYPGRSPFAPPYAQLPSPGQAVELRVWGSALSLEVLRGPGLGVLTVSVDALPTDVTVELAAPALHVEQVRIASRMPVGLHRLEVRSDAASLAAIRSVRVGRRLPWLRWLAPLGAALLGAAWLGIIVWRASARLPWRVGWAWLQRLSRLLPDGWYALLVGLACVGMVGAPLGWARLFGLAALAAGACLRPRLALMVSIASIPLAPLHARLGPASFSLLEVTIWVALGASIWNGLLAARPGPPMSPRAWWRRLSLADAAVLALALMGLITSLLAEYRHEALREWRTVILGPVVLYALLRSQRWQGRALSGVLDVLWLSAVGLALYALLIYPTPWGVIEAEGVRRARAFYGSPNNLALYLERVWPLGLAVALRGGTRWRRWAYGLGAAVVGVAVVLTFSRGAWLLGLPAGLLVLGWAQGRGTRRILLAVALVGLLALVPLAATARLASLADFTEGTAGLRIKLWLSAWDMARDHCWLGVGPDNFLYYYGDYLRPGAEIERWLSHPHNIVLDFWLRLGLAGLPILGLLLAAFVRLWRRAGALRLEQDQQAMLVGLLAGGAAMLLHGMIDASFFVMELAAWFLVALAWMGSLSRRTCS